MENSEIKQKVDVDVEGYGKRWRGRYLQLEDWEQLFLKVKKWKSVSSY